MKCKKCNSENLVMRPNAKNPSATELICANCGTWQKFIGKEEIRLFEIHHQKQVPSPTNADRIRGMSDAQHAHFLVHVVSDGCPPDMDWDCQKDKDGWDACDKCWERWLQQPAETEGTE